MLNLTTLFPFKTYPNINTLAIAFDNAVEMPAPVTPSFGNPSKPYINSALPITFKKLHLKFIIIGTFVSPIPLNAADMDILRD